MIGYYRLGRLIVYVYGSIVYSCLLFVLARRKEMLRRGLRRVKRVARPFVGQPIEERR